MPTAHQQETEHGQHQNPKCKIVPPRPEKEWKKHDLNHKIRNIDPKNPKISSLSSIKKLDPKFYNQ